MSEEVKIGDSFYREKAYKLEKENEKLNKALEKCKVQRNCYIALMKANEDCADCPPIRLTRSNLEQVFISDQEIEEILK